MRVGEHTSVPQAGQRKYGTSTLGVSGGVEDHNHILYRSLRTEVGLHGTDAWQCERMDRT